LTGQYLLLGTLFWELTRIPQYSISVGVLWNIWSRNLSNMFVSPISPAEYLTALSISGLVKSLLMFCIDAVIVATFFHFSVWQIPIWMLLLFWLNIFIFSVSLGIIIMGWIFRYGVRVQAFAWSLMPMLQPLTAALFPLSVLLSPLKELALIFPITHIFEAARQSLTTGTFNWSQFGIASALNLVYFIGSIFYFSHMYKQARNSGQFARNEG
jgi:ABC-2 type transport system permease protein